jgi:SH3-like domain-containing protein
VKRHPAKTPQALVLAALLAVGVAAAAEYKTTAEAPTVLYDAPSTRARPLFVYGRDVPLEVLVVVEGWTKIRDVGGAFGWIPNKGLADKRMLLVRTPTAEIRAHPDDASAIVFRAEQNVLLDLAESAASPGTTATPGWVKVRHRDGQTGYVRLGQVFGL